MKLFFSYGHDKNEEIVMRLKEDLEKRGHSVWIDKSKIKSGDDWRKSITTGILDSEILISFASKHSIRKPGVCLDELMIAVSVKGAQIQSVLLEVNIEPPSNLGYRQYIDMSNWAEMKQHGNFDEWYHDKLEQILAVVESPETANYAKEMEYIKQQLVPDLSASKKDRLEQECFYGREWLSNKVKDWLQKEDASKILLMQGAPGIGKSSFIAHEFMFNPSVGAVLFCEWDNFSLNNIDAISRSLIFQLAAKLSDYRSQVIRCLQLECETREVGANSFNGNYLFKSLMIHQLNSLVDGNRPVIVILLDGIDEISDNNESGRNRNALAELLQEELARLPRWIRFIVTSRYDSRITVPLQNVKIIQIDAEEDNNHKDIQIYLDNELKHKYSLETIKKLARLSDGNFLYARLIVDALKKNLMTLDNVFKGGNLGLNSVFIHCFDRLFPDLDKYELLYYKSLAALAVADEKIPYETFVNITAWPKRKVNQYMKAFSQLLSSEREFIRLYHKSIKDWILSESADDYMVDFYDGVKAIADACYYSYESNKPAMNSFERKYLINYMKKAGDSRLKKVLSDIDFAEVLMKKAIEEKKIFKYDSAECFAKSAVDIYRFVEDWNCVANASLLLADITDLMVKLDESLKWCEDIIKIANDYKGQITDEIIAKAYLVSANIFFRKGKWDDSVKAYRNSFAIFQKAGNINELIYAKVMCANVLRNGNDYVSSLSLFKEVEELFVAYSFAQTDKKLFTYFQMFYGWALHDAGRYQEAEHCLCCAESLISDSKVSLEARYIAQIYYLRSIELFSSADYENAEKYCNMALHYVALAYGENAVEICSALNELGAIAQELKKLDEAVAIFKRSYELRLRYYGENNLFTSISLRNYGYALLLKGDDENIREAGKIFERVKAVRERLVESGKGYLWLSHIYMDLAEFEKQTGNYYDAEDYVNKAMQLHNNQNSVPINISICKMKLGELKIQMGDIESAKMLILDAIDIVKGDFEDSHPHMAKLYQLKAVCFAKG